MGSGYWVGCCPILNQLQTLHFCGAHWCSLTFGLTEGPNQSVSCAVDERRGINASSTPGIPCRSAVTERLRAHSAEEQYNLIFLFFIFLRVPSHPQNSLKQ